MLLVWLASGSLFAATLVEMKTSHGTIQIELYPEKAPKTVENFLAYADRGFYDGTIFHRVINGFMIQGGGLQEDMTAKPTLAPIENEADNGLKNDAYTVAMARTNNPHSATCQFFINVKKNDMLNFKSKTPQGWGYAVFGKVTQGQGVVNKIKAAATTEKSGHADVPQVPITITKAEVTA